MTNYAITFPWPDSRLSPNGTRNARLRARLTKTERTRAAEVAHAAGITPMAGLAPVVFDFHPPSARWDDDNVRAMGKAIRDGIADAIAMNDRDFAIDYRVGAPVKGGSVLVTFAPIPD